MEQPSTSGAQFSAGFCVLHFAEDLNPGLLTVSCATLCLASGPQSFRVPMYHGGKGTDSGYRPLGSVPCPATY